MLASQFSSGNCATIPRRQKGGHGSQGIRTAPPCSSEADQLKPYSKRESLSSRGVSFWTPNERATSLIRSKIWSYAKSICASRKGSREWATDRAIRESSKMVNRFSHNHSASADREEFFSRTRLNSGGMTTRLSMTRRFWSTDDSPLRVPSVPQIDPGTTRMTLTIPDRFASSKDRSDENASEIFFTI